jgi:hypothetical protein
LLVFLGFVILIVTIVLYYAARKKRPPEFNPNEKKKEEGVVTVKTPRRWRRWIVWALILTIIIFAALKFFPDIENNFDKPRQESATERLCIPAQEERWTKVPIPETWPGWRLHIDEIPGTWVSFLLPEGIEYGPYGPYDKIKLPAGIRNFSIKGNRTFCIFPK